MYSRSRARQKSYEEKPSEPSQVTTSRFSNESRWHQDCWVVSTKSNRSLKSTRSFQGRDAAVVWTLEARNPCGFVVALRRPVLSALALAAASPSWVADVGLA